MKEKYRQILIHVVGCLSFLALAFIPLFQGKTNTIFNPMAVREFLGYGVLLLIFYFNYFILVPRLYFFKKYLLYFLSIGLIYLGFRNTTSFVITQSEFLHQAPPNMSMNRRSPPPRENFTPQFDKPNNNHPPENDMFIDVNQKVFPFLVVIFFSLMLRLSSRWQQTEREKTNAELAYLKAQINPHFLFNTLNSIYSLAIQKSDETPTAVVKLSGMMRYVLSESSNDFVPLEREITYIQNYIDLQKIRFEDAISLDFVVNGDMKGKKIAPLMLIPFIENAFKHGVNAEEESVIKIHIATAENELYLSVFNKKVTVHISEENKSGLGVENTKNRLEHLYPEKHKLAIYDTKDEYLVELLMKL
ncbi:sensor histidine kinase [Emticicia sp. SJ17W-69]|uniref:sensor histidine kinase n=1 Tax=Emticicia sp. SJ17W-69 TaxID=3421657 RepID=UPI003EBB1BB3